MAAELITDTCGFAVPFMDYQGERTLHSDYFGRKTDEQFAEYCAAKPYNAASLDGLPALPLPLPARAARRPGPVIALSEIGHFRIWLDTGT